jgi:hypothetical protein
VRAYARLLIEREEDLVREHEHDAIVHPSVLGAQMADILPARSFMVQESSTARTTLIPFGHEAMGWTRSGGGSLGFGVGAAVGAKIAAGRERPVVLHLGDGALTYSAAGFWTMARYNTAILTVVSNNETYQIVRTNWAREVPDSKMVRDGRYQAFIWAPPPLRCPRPFAGRGWRSRHDREGARAGPAAGYGANRRNRPYLIELRSRGKLGAESTGIELATLIREIRGASVRGCRDRAGSGGPRVGVAGRHSPRRKE